MYSVGALTIIEVSGSPQPVMGTCPAALVALTLLSSTKLLLRVGLGFEKKCHTFKLANSIKNKGVNIYQ